MIKEIKNLFLFSFLAFSLVLSADNPGDDVVNEEPAEVAEETVESAPSSDSTDIWQYW